MSSAAIVIISPRQRTSPRHPAQWARAALGAGLDEVVVVLSDDLPVPGDLPDAVSILADSSGLGTARALRSALDYVARARHSTVLVAADDAGVDDRALSEVATWRALASSNGVVLGVATRDNARVGLLRLEAGAWPLVPLEGPLQTFLEAQAASVREIEVADSAGLAPAASATESDEDRRVVGELLGRSQLGRFSVVLRDPAGVPLVIENEPILEDGTPMPTRYWLVGKKAVLAVSRLESSGGVHAAEAAVDPTALADSHARYAALRDAAIDPRHSGPRPSGGVGGTRQGVKCLHAHLAWYLVGGADPVGRWVADQIGAELDGPVAAIDCGTNSTRLLVLSPERTSLAREAIITRLGEGVDATGSLSPGAIARTLSVLAQYRKRCDELGVVRLRASATSAARDAANAAELFDPAALVLGAPLELLAGTEEGRLSYLGATYDQPDGPHLVVDLGGGSTELIAGSPDPGAAPTVVSMNVGCVRISERFLTSDPPSAGEIAQARAHLRSVLQETLDAQPALLSPPQMIGVAGTVSTLASLELGLASYDGDVVNGTVLSLGRVESFAEELLKEDVATRRARPGIEAGRADVIAAGALVLAEVMAATGHDELVYSEADILDGVAIELLG